MADPRGGDAPLGDADDRMLARLHAAFAVEPVDPPAQGVAALDRALAERDVRGEAGGRHRRPWWRQPLPVAGLAFGLVVGGSGTALAAGASLPRPVRALAHDLGLPVDSPQLVDVRKANDRLRDDLRPPTTAPETARDAADLARKLAGLDKDERAEVKTESSDLLEQARGGHAGPGGPSVSSAGSQSGPGGGSGSGTSGSGTSDSGSGPSGHGGDDGRTTATTSPAGSSTPPTTIDNSHGGGTPSGSDGGSGSGGSDGGSGSGGDGGGGSGSGSSGSSGSDATSGGGSTGGGG